MRKLIPVLLLIVAAAAPGATPEEFDRIVNFTDSIETLSTLVRTQRYDEIDVTRYYILEGAVVSTQVFDPNPETFQAVVELVSSRWVGLEEIEVYHIYVLVEGPEYASRLPQQLPRDPGPEIIQRNQRLVVAGPFIGTAMLDSEHEVPVVQAVGLR